MLNSSDYDYVSIGMVVRIAVLLILMMATGIAFPAASGKISWRVEAGFAPFSYASDPDSLMKSWRKISQQPFEHWVSGLSPSEARSPFDEMIRSAKRDRRGNVIGNIGPWSTSTGQYDRTYVHPASTILRATLQGVSGLCQWSLDDSPVNGPLPCHEDARILDVPLRGATLSVVTFDRDERVSVEIEVDHKIILAIGDSYASGEGNPDIPTVWSSGSVEPNSLSWLDERISEDAEWWDNKCHRSFWNNQTLIALKTAAANPHRLVTFLQYSCSGAEVLDGLLTRQHKPPGIGKICRGPDCYLASSQLAAAATDLCQGTTTAVSKQDSLAKHIRSIVKAPNRRLYRAGSYNRGGLNLVRCASGLIRPDLVLLSIGGNDAGFAQFAAWAIVPDEWRFRPLIIPSPIDIERLVKGGLVCPQSAKTKGCKKPFDIDLARQLERRFALLARAISDVFGIAPKKIVQNTYPDPLIQSTGKVCGDPSGSNLDGPWTGAAFVVSKRLLGLGGAFGATEWEFNIRKGELGEASILSNNTIKSMTNFMRSGIRTNGYVLADLSQAFKDHGWCSPVPSDPPQALPSFDPQAWRCGSNGAFGNPACWKPYAPSKRYIRTINDSLLTQQSSRRDGHTGSLHPNIGGHARMADLIFHTAHGVHAWIGD